MSPAQLLLIPVVYGAVYYVLARGAVGRLMDVDADYRGRWSRPGVGADPENSFAILHIMFNMNLPRDMDSPRHALAVAVRAVRRTVHRHAVTERPA